MASRALCLAALAAASVAAVDPPQQLHLAYAGIASGYGMSVSWMTMNQTATSTVRYGLTAAFLNSTATGAATSYYTTFQHHVVLTGLTPSTRYFYTAGDAIAGWSSVNSFMTAPVAGNEFPLNIAVFGDMGNYNSNATFLDLARIAPDMDFIYHVGDISYADDDYLHDPFQDNYENTWNKFLTNMQPFTQEMAYMVLPGNHEANCHSPVCVLTPSKLDAFANFSAYNHRFRMPSPESSGTMNMWYYFMYGSVFFVQIDTETDYPNAPLDDYFSKTGGFGDQLKWLQATLATAAALRTAGKVSWIFVAGHRPVYSRASANADGTPSGSATALQTAVEALFVQYGVDIYFCGHEHSVEVSWPVYNNTAVQSYNQPPYPVYVVTGAAGCDEGHTSYDSAPQTSWNRFTDGTNYGLSVMNIQDANTLTWTFRRATDGATLDTFTLTRK